MKTSKIKYYFWIPLCIFTLGLSLQAQDETETTTVEVQGIGRDADGAQKNALYQAVQQAVGAYLDQETLVKNEEVIQDKLLSVAQGFVESFTPIVPAKERHDGSGLWEIKIKAVVKKSAVGAALRTAGVMQVKADGSSGWAQQVTKMKSREDAMELLKKVLPEITRNLACGRIIQNGDKMTTREDKITGDQMVELKIEYDTNIDWWNKEAYPALDAALTALNLLDNPPVVNNLSAVMGKNGLAFLPDKSSKDTNHENLLTTVKIFNSTSKLRLVWSVKEFHLPVNWANDFRVLYESSIKNPNLKLFDLEFTDSNSESLCVIPIEKKVLEDRADLNILINYSRQNVMFMFPSLFSRASYDLYPEEKMGITYSNQPVSLTYQIKASDAVLRETKSLKLIPGEFGVIEKSLRKSIEVSPHEVAMPGAGATGKTTTKINPEQGKPEVSETDARLAVLTTIWREETATINRITHNKTIPVREGSKEYYECLKASQRIQQAEAEAKELKARKSLAK